MRCDMIQILLWNYKTKITEQWKLYFEKKYHSKFAALSGSLLYAYNYILAERGNAMNNPKVFKFGNWLSQKSKITFHNGIVSITQNKKLQSIKLSEISKIYHSKGAPTKSSIGKICFSDRDDLSLRDILLADLAFTYPIKQLPQAEKFLNLLEEIPVEEVHGLAEESLNFYEEQQKQALNIETQPQEINNLGLAEFDETNKVARFFTGYTAGGWEEVPFELIKGYEVEENGETKVASGAKAAAIGTVLFGSAGMVAGAIIGNGKEQEFADNLNLAIMLKGKTTIRVKLLSKRIKKNSAKYQQAVDSIELIVTRLNPIIRENISEEEVVSENICEKKQTENTRQSTVDDIREFKALLDEGIITTEEFDQKKKELLGL